jgi:hypothetical protein
MKLFCLSIAQPDAGLEKFMPYLKDEVRHTWQLYKSEVVRDIYFRKDLPGVVIIAESDSVEDCRKALDEVPLAKAGLISWDVIPVGPFSNWELLFASDNT